MTLLAHALLEVVRGTTLCLPVLQMAACLTIDNSRSAAGNPWDKLLTLGERASSPVSWECIIDILNSHTFLNSAMLGYHTQKAMFRTPLSRGSKVTYKSWSNLQVVEARKNLQQLKMGWGGGGTCHCCSHTAEGNVWRHFAHPQRLQLKLLRNCTKHGKKFAHLWRRALIIT